MRAGCVLCCHRDTRRRSCGFCSSSRGRAGLGLGRRLVEECVAFARLAMYESIVLWTNDVLVAARRIYEAVGFRLIDETPHRSFGHNLVGQTWRLELAVRPAPDGAHG